MIAILLIDRQISQPFWKGSLSLLFLVLLYSMAGFAHLVVPESFLPIVPDAVPFPDYIVVATGLCEIAGALALFSSRLRRLASAMLALYALCVWPANIKHALMTIETATFPASWWYHAPRLALQPVLIWWALSVGGWFAHQNNQQ